MTPTSEPSNPPTDEEPASGLASVLESEPESEVASVPEPVLVFPPRANDTAHVLAAAAAQRGLRTEIMSSWRVPDHLRAHGEAHLYAGPLFADAVAHDLGLVLLEPRDAWLAELPRSLTRRDIKATTIDVARRVRRPAFIKAPNDKLFPARVYVDGSRLPGSDAVDDDMLVLVSDIVAFDREFRLFVLDGEVHTASQYAVQGELVIAPLAGHADERAVMRFADDLLITLGHTLPSAVVVDVGVVRDDDGPEKLAVIEANPAWASGHYACDPERVLDVVLRASFDRRLLTERDAPFQRRARLVVL